MKIYLAGKITDTSFLGKHFPKLKTLRERKNLHRFYEKAKELRHLGVEVFNPVLNEPPQASRTKWEEYLAEDLKAMQESNITHIYLMVGWHRSKGAKLEKSFAEALGITPIYETN